jgi:hypothetical protein
MCITIYCLCVCVCVCVYTYIYNIYVYYIYICIYMYIYTKVVGAPICVFSVLKYKPDEPPRRLEGEPDEVSSHEL